MLLKTKISFYKSVSGSMRKSLLQFMGIIDFQCDTDNFKKFQGHTF